MGGIKMLIYKDFGAGYHIALTDREFESFREVCECAHEKANHGSAWYGIEKFAKDLYTKVEEAINAK
jgi:hypothetical protein